MTQKLEEFRVLKNKLEPNLNECIVVHKSNYEKHKSAIERLIADHNKKLNDLETEYVRFVNKTNVALSTINDDAKTNEFLEVVTSLPDAEDKLKACYEAIDDLCDIDHQ